MISGKVLRRAWSADGRVRRCLDCERLLPLPPTKHRDGEVHVRASWIFSRSDVIANAGIIAAGLLVAVTGSRWPDLIVGNRDGCPQRREGDIARRD